MEKLNFDEARLVVAISIYKKKKNYLFQLDFSIEEEIRAPTIDCFKLM